jgi:hypothetical protein
MAFGANLRSTLPTEGVKRPLGSLGSMTHISCHDLRFTVTPLLFMGAFCQSLIMDEEDIDTVGNQLFLDAYSKKAISDVRSVLTHIV